MRTEKRTEPVVLAPATDKHPVQVKEVTKDVNIGKYIESVWSGMISPAEKSDLLSRIDALLITVKQARQRANNTDIVNIHIGQVFADYIMGSR